jgi:hypothetical protein
MSSDIPTEIGSILQGASINRQPSPHHDLNPSTAASQKQPVRLDEHPDPGSEADEDEIPVSVLNPVPRKKTMPPLPDLRFEQSYLKSIEQAEGWQGVLWITLRDQVRALYERSPKRRNKLTIMAGHNVLCARCTMDPPPQWLATHEPINQVQRTERRRAGTEMVVGREQLDDTERKV